jgi:hypothetical protein
MSGISDLLERRGAWLKGASPDYAMAMARQELTLAISRDYPVFEAIRDVILESENSERSKMPAEEAGTELLPLLVKHRVAVEKDGAFVPVDTSDARKYLSGFWLEELAWLAANESGAQEAVFGQVLGWNVKGYTGENEIDLIALKDGKLYFISCKALRSVLDLQDRKHRNRLMDAVHEADNLIDHFGRMGDKVAVMVTTDLIDELRGTARYAALAGKSAVLDVHLISLEDLPWEKLVALMGRLWRGEI